MYKNLEEERRTERQRDLREEFIKVGETINKLSQQEHLAIDSISTLRLLDNKGYFIEFRIKVYL